MRFLEKLLNFPVRDDDDESTKLRKQLFMVFYALVIVVNFVSAFVIEYVLGVYNAYFITAVSALGLIHLVYTKTLAIKTVVAYVLICCVVIVIYDIGTASQGTSRAWPIVVVMIDILLVTRTDRRVSHYLVLCTILFLTLSAIESAVRFGLYDLPGLMSQAKRRSYIECSRLPCANKMGAMQNYLIYMVTFILDYVFTRGFADSLMEEKQKVEASVETAEQIAEFLSKFDLDTSEEILSNTKDSLPPKLHIAFTSILKNLKIYRPFLPDALFNDEEFVPSANVPSVVPPGTGDDDVAIVFTDIQESTAIWEACPAAMKRALKTHNRAIREVMELYQGYEVKTIGDAFMVAFGSVNSGVLFSLAVQLDLLSSTWPNELVDNVICCRRDSDSLWGGLRVRVGVHCGPVDIEYNPITGRFDYFGNTVNVAARVEAASVGGGVAVTPEVLAGLSISAHTYVEIPIGPTDLKGVKDSMRLSILLPADLEGRRSYIESRYRCKGTVPAEAIFTVSSLYSTNHISDVPATRMEDLASVTLGCVELCGEDTKYCNLNDRLCKVLHGLDRSNGTVVCLAGPVLTVGWNTAKRVLTHFDSALRFVSMVSQKGRENCDALVGLATGVAWSTTLGTHGQRFVTVGGDTLRIAQAVLALCAELETVNLLAYKGEPRADLRPLVRPVAVLLAGEKEITAYELCVQREVNMTDGEVISLNETEWCWSQEYWEAFAAMEADVIRGYAGGDRTVRRVAQMLAAGVRREVWMGC
eukprot:TRINITY_DN386_c0_g1_i2.p1 TRINITY_DN386_c0_g1~~TRINITY_DN386_c0_g1_i2.p1  ORF type:complete len:766 (+),score=232.48 TRINITY_DN386_c0_g1_i2:33-2300(+)